MRSLTKLVQHSAYRVSSHRLNVAASHIMIYFKFIWFGYVARLFQWGGERVFYLPIEITTFLRGDWIGGGGGDTTPWLAGILGLKKS